ncbi:MAG: cobalamin biosynthesis protein CobW [Ruminococcaceae bacterium]|nr:cobalamin biosynthesis protein CobW [Oscillospiraceae bacterium]
MTKIDIFSGFLGAGKTTLIKKLIKEAYAGEKLVLIENEFGEIGIDGGFMKEAGIEITEMNSGCICCSLVGDFTQSLTQVLEQFTPDRILIEPSGVGKLSDVIKAVQKVETDSVKLNSFTTVADAGKCRIYAKNFGEFYNDQLQHAKCVVLSRTGGMSHEKVEAAVAQVRQMNPAATLITTPWEKLSGEVILAAMEQTNSLKHEIHHLEEEETCPVCGHHHEHHHHHHDEEGHHEHHHHDEDGCHCHDHEHHHHHHHADDVFDSWGVETTATFTVEEIESALNDLAQADVYGIVLRAKGIVAGANGQWIHFDYVPGAPDVRTGGADVIGRLCVIGSGIHKDALAELFSV